MIPDLLTHHLVYGRPMDEVKALLGEPYRVWKMTDGEECWEYWLGHRRLFEIEILCVDISSEEGFLWAEVVQRD